MDANRADLREVHVSEIRGARQGDPAEGAARAAIGQFLRQHDGGPFAAGPADPGECPPAAADSAVSAGARANASQRGAVGDLRDCAATWNVPDAAADRAWLVDQPALADERPA